MSGFLVVFEYALLWGWKECGWGLLVVGTLLGCEAARVACLVFSLPVAADCFGWWWWVWGCCLSTA